MQIVLPIHEAIALVRAVRPLPALVRSVEGTGSQVTIEVDLRLVPNASTALRLAAAAVGTVAASARFLTYAGGVATFEVTAQARSLPAHKLLNHVTGPVNAALTERGLPDGLVEVRKGDGEPILAVHIQEAVEAKAPGVTITGIEMHDGAVHVTADVADGVAHGVALRR
jgi:hypothetical protein